MRVSILAGVGSRLPARKVTNEAVAAEIGKLTEWLYTRSAIRSRHVVEAGVTTGNIEHVGNTSAVSFPVLLDHAHQARDLAPGQRVLLTALGGGRAWGATTLVWPRLDRPT
ncbi:3-oxoacyl-[acyl-carrier-protein] synthase III C-terminal domain-containing protein [Streptomyces sp. NPDC090442]|uniref:3-oxoacyl-[acyl-carrier-protein] synthase III C-terminal domain-containing protein n=1 Tax=Streptomyces sp. NPDC090442 TaxID=3365962 RepID=UPI0037F84DD3